MYNDIIRRDLIILPHMEFTACHGVLDFEHTTPQEFHVCVSVLTDLEKAGETDDVEDTVSYAEIYEKVEAVIMGEHCNLLERLASKMCESILEDEKLLTARVKITKVKAPMGSGIPAAVEITRTGADYGL